MPALIQIGPYLYSVELVEFEDPSRLGDIRYGQERIRISRDSAPNQQRDSLLHEVIHGCFQVSGCSEQDWNEQATSVLTTVLLDTLRRNPALVDYLMDGVK